MRVFIGSSSKAVQDGDVRLVADHIQRAGLIPRLWSAPGAFVANDALWTALLSATTEVDAAAFIFREDDRFESEDGSISLVRDNVLLELGLFSGALFERTRHYLNQG
jgi:predicted nucleotide-binding protein